MKKGTSSKPIITKGDYWTYIEPNTDYELPSGWEEHGGKLMVFGNEQQIIPLANKLGKYLTKGKIISLKYGAPVPGIYKSWGLMIYCMDSDIDDVWDILKLKGVKKKIWKYNQQTEIDWQPGGRLFNKFYGM